MRILLNHKRRIFLFEILAALLLNPVSAISQTPTTDTYSQAVSLFQAKQYAAALPLFEKAVQENPTAQAYYYLGYCQYMGKQVKEAIVNFYHSDSLKANPSLTAYADKLYDGLSDEDKQWVVQNSLGPPNFPVTLSNAANPQAE